jgi:beta-galactosidase
MGSFRCTASEGSIPDVNLKKSLIRRLLLLSLAPTLVVALHAADRFTLNFNLDWRFLKADPAGAAQPGFDDHAWTTVSTPHTFNDTDTFDNWSTPGVRGEQIQWSGRTWYRKTFPAPEAWRGKLIFIEFEAVRQVAEVYLNGEKLGVCKTGFTPFGFDLTSHLKIGTSNVLAVMVDNRFVCVPLDAAAAADVARRNGEDSAVRPPSTKDLNLRDFLVKLNEQIPERIEDLQADQIPWNNPVWHPAHGGIYRNVRLFITDPLHITLPLYSFLETAGPYVYATDISPASARIIVEVPLQNNRRVSQNVEVQAEILDASGAVALTLAKSEPLAADTKGMVKLTGVLDHPRLWEPDYPHVYRVVCSLRVGGVTVDSSEVPLGIRAVRWDVDAGLFINGNHLKLHGWGHKPTDEWPGLGAALPDWLHFQTLALMKQAGGNFVRWGHAAAGPAQISAADVLGLVTVQPGVDGESDTVKAAWMLRASAFRDVLIYFRNQPSILIWEGGNQKVIREHAAELRELMDKYDPQGGRAYTHRRADNIVAEFMDVCEGTEGSREISWLPLVEGEYDREESPRRVWDDASPPSFGYPEAKGMAYHLTSEQFAVNQIRQYRKISEPDHCGGANWIFSDSTSGGRVPAEVARASGEVDGVRLPKEAYYVCSVIFRADPQVHIIGHWTYPADTRKTIYIAANLDDVELFLNGRSLGHGRRSESYLFTFEDIAFAPGELKAVGRRERTVVATHSLHTVGPAVALKLTPHLAPKGWLADGQDVALVDVEAVDADGERCPTFQQRVDFETDGPGVWRGGYNSGKIHSVNHPSLDLECGINRVAIRSTRVAGVVTVSAKCAGLRAGRVALTAQRFAANDGVTAIPPATPVVSLPFVVPAHPAFSAPAALMKSAGAKRPTLAGAGSCIKSFNYTGPQSAIVHVEIQVRNGAKVYVDRNYTFSDLPADLMGADWVQVADADQGYSAMDLIEMAVKGGTVVTIAHDESIAPPGWLTRQFKATGHRIIVHDRRMALFQRTVDRDASLTLGSNADAAAPQTGAMYLVFVNDRH